MREARGRHATALGVAVAGVLLAPTPGAFALDPALEVNQYSHTAWHALGRRRVWALAWKPGPPRRYALPHMRISDLTKADAGQVLIAVSGAGLKQFAGDQVKSYPIEAQSIRIRRCRTATSMRTSCSGAAMADSGSGPWSAGSSTCIAAGQTYSGEPMASQATSSSGCSRIVKAISGSPPPEDSTGFESCPSPRFRRNKACPGSQHQLRDRSHGWERVGRHSRRPHPVDERTARCPCHDLPQGEWTAGRHGSVSVPGSSWPRLGLHGWRAGGAAIPGNSGRRAWGSSTCASARGSCRARSSWTADPAEGRRFRCDPVSTPGIESRSSRSADALENRIASLERDAPRRMASGSTSADARRAARPRRGSRWLLQKTSVVGR